MPNENSLLGRCLMALIMQENWGSLEPSKSKRNWVYEDKRNMGEDLGKFGFQIITCKQKNLHTMGNHALPIGWGSFYANICSQLDCLLKITSCVVCIQWHNLSIPNMTSFLLKKFSDISVVCCMTSPSTDGKQHVCCTIGKIKLGVFP